jgi:hypothetical protein
MTAGMIKALQLDDKEATIIGSRERNLPAFFVFLSLRV